MSADFSGASAAPPAPPRSDLARRILIGCGIVALVVVGAFVAFIIYVRRNPATMTDLMMKQIESHYASDVTEEQKRDLRQAYADFRSAISGRRVSAGKMQRIQITLSGANREFTSEQVRNLTAEFRGAAAAETTGRPVPTPPSAVPSTTPVS